MISICVLLLVTLYSSSLLLFPSTSLDHGVRAPCQSSFGSQICAVRPWKYTSDHITILNHYWITHYTNMNTHWNSWTKKSVLWFHNVKHKTKLTSTRFTNIQSTIYVITFIQRNSMQDSAVVLAPIPLHFCMDSSCCIVCWLTSCFHYFCVSRCSHNRFNWFNWFSQGSQLCRQLTQETTYIDCFGLGRAVHRPATLGSAWICLDLGPVIRHLTHHVTLKFTVKSARSCLNPQVSFSAQRGSLGKPLLQRKQSAESCRIGGRQHITTYYNICRHERAHRLKLRQLRPKKSSLQECSVFPVWFAWNICRQFVNSNHVIRINSERGKGPPAEDAASGKTTRRGPTRPDSAFGHQHFPTKT